MTNKKITTLFSDLQNNNQIFLNYLKAKFPIFHNSNFFFRDFQYGLKGYLEKKTIQMTWRDIEELSKLLCDYYVSKKIFIKISSQVCKLNYPEFVTSKPGDPFSFN